MLENTRIRLIRHPLCVKAVPMDVTLLTIERQKDNTMKTLIVCFVEQGHHFLLLPQIAILAVVENISIKTMQC
jgi:hypothetical protein